MRTFTPLIPGQPVPALRLPTVKHGEWVLSDRSPEHFTMLVFYRGYHCSFCARYLADLTRKLEKFAETGIEAIAISADTEDRAINTYEDWKLDPLSLGYNLPLTKAREWGLFISARNYKPVTGIEEPPLFIEPGVFLVRPNNTLYWSSVQTMPFARPSLNDILLAMNLIIECDYPARGEVVDLPAAAE